MFQHDFILVCACAAIAMAASFPLTARAAEDDSFVKPEMYFSDDTYGGFMAKDPDVVHFKGAYYLYYSVTDRENKKLVVGIARSEDLTHWTKVGENRPEQECEKNGLGAPCVIVLDGKVHTFYQTYGNWEKDAICHAVSEDGVNFTRDPSNPIFAPKGDWTVGRAIDAEVIPFEGKLLLYWATRDPGMKIQMIGVAGAPLGSGYGRDSWTQLCNAPILKPELDWEQECIEASSVVERDGKLYMFYAGAYNCRPQQIGVAVSDDGIAWTRLSNRPLLPHGPADAWNAHESGHPGVFVDDDGATYLFFQGSRDKGKTWWLSKMHVRWEDAGPYLIRPRDGKEFHLKK